MHGLPLTFDVSPFAGTRLDSITFAEFGVHFHFERGGRPMISVSESSMYTYAIGASDLTYERAEAVVESRVMQLVGKSVTRARVWDECTLALDFEEGSTLAFLDDDPNYECYVIEVDGVTTAV